MKPFRKKIYLFSCFFVLIFSKCECPSEYPLYIYNKTPKQVNARIYSLDSDTFSIEFNYTITLDTFDMDIVRFVSPWRKVCGDLKLDTVSFFFIDSDTVSQHSWQEIAEKNLILQRYDLSISDVEWLDNQITYPPTPKMSGMKMYPPYEESYKK